MMRWFVACVIWLSLTSVASAQGAVRPVDGDSPAAASDRADYRLGAGDKVRINVFGEESLSGEFIIPGDPGTISFPLIGDVRASGLTVGELQIELTSKLKPDYLKDPRISIEVLNYRPFYILGEVAHPGEYPYTNGLTVLNAVATANGFTYRANTHLVYIKRAGTTKEVQLPLGETTVVEPGDTIRIGERFF
jgi:protein involved in polysaccharide export with SLBB domain